MTPISPCAQLLESLKQEHGDQLGLDGKGPAKAITLTERRTMIEPDPSTSVPDAPANVELSEIRLDGASQRMAEVLGRVGES